MDEAAGIVGSRERGHALGARIVGPGKVGGAADHLRHGCREWFKRAFRGAAGGDLFRRGGKLLLHAAHGSGEFFLQQFTTQTALELGTLLGSERCESLRPGLPLRLAALANAMPCIARVSRHLECGRGPAEFFARTLDLVGAERRAM